MKRVHLVLVLCSLCMHIAAQTYPEKTRWEEILPDTTSGFSIYRWAMTESTYMPQPFLDSLSTANGERYVLLMPNDEAMKYYVDAASFNTTTKKMICMRWKDATFPILTQNYVYDFATGTVGRRISGTLATLSYDATVDYLKMMRMSHTLVLTRPEDAEKGLLSGNRYFQALDGSVVKVLTDEGGNPKAFQGALQMQNEAAGLEAFNQCAIGRTWQKGSFDLYEIAQPVIHSPYNVQWVLQSGNEEDNPFAAFYELTCADTQCFSDCGLTGITPLLPYLSSEGEDRLNYTNDKPFTLFVPTNEAIAREIENGLPTWQSIRAYIDAHIISAPDGSFMWDHEKNRLNAARQCLTLINFIKAHVMQDVEIADQLPFTRTHASALTKNGEAAMLEVKSNGGEQMTVSDGEHICNVLDRKNIFTVDKVRDYPSSGPYSSNTIRVFSYHPGIIHQIDGVLNYAEGDMSQLPAAPEAINYNEFAFSLFNEMQQEAKGENVVCSPLSAELAMGMQANGAAGNTLREIQEVFGTAGHSLDEVNAYNSQLMQTMMRERTMTDLEKEQGFTEKHLPGIAFANGIWTKVPLHDSFIETNQTYYDAELQQNVNFGLQETMDGIDQWVREKTRGTIPSINVEPNPDIASMLINALYFKGVWISPFDEYNTSNRSFTNADGREVLVPMMYQDEAKPYAELPSCKAVKLSYVGNNNSFDDSDFSMTLFLPNEEAQDFQLTEDLWNEARQQLKWEYVNLDLPRFEVDTETTLNNMLQSMGIHDAFNPNIADLSKMSPVPTFIGLIKQLCHVSVDEKGTEASSATIFVDVPMGIHQYKSFCADHPFYFTIENNTTGTVLFVGKINQLEDTSDPTLADYSHFVKGGKIWKMGWFDGDSQEAHALEYHYIDGDTIVNGIRCKKMMRIMKSVAGEWERYLGAVYEANRVVYAALAGQNQFYPIYDFMSAQGKDVYVLNTGLNQFFYTTMGATTARESEVFKGNCREVKLSNGDTVEWMQGIGYLGFHNLPDYEKTTGWLRLMECTLGDEVLYYDASLIDGVTPPEQQEARKNRLDFSHIIKSQPKVPKHKAPDANESLSGEYSTKELFVNFLPLKGKYNVTLTDAEGEEVYTKQVQTDNVLALNTDIAKYAAGTYTLTVENDNESYEASFVIEGTGIDGLSPSSSQIGTGVIYDLQGKKITQAIPPLGEGRRGLLPKGIYIMNGKKVVVK